MIFDTRRKLCFLANTKTGSTTIERWASPTFQQVRFNNVPYKHADYRAFAKFCAIFDVDPDTIETICVVRHPLDKAQSWYKYRTRPEIQDPKHPKHANSLAGTTFEEFLLKQIERAREGKEVGLFCDRYFVQDEAGAVAVKRIYRYEDIDACIAYLQERFEIAKRPKKRNVSPPADLSVSAETRALFDEVFAEHISWYESLPRYDAPEPEPEPAEEGQDVPEASAGDTGDTAP